MDKTAILLQRTVKEFLKNNYDPSKPVLLAYSGGGDSEALFHLLLHWKKELSIDFHLAHVDHKWRKESSQEAEMLKKNAQKKNIPFHIKTLELSKNNTNAEAICRDLRNTFFAQLIKKHDFQALLLAHHADDAAETVLKRFLEGAHFSSIDGSMQMISKIKGITIWRPLLPFYKKELVNYLDHYELLSIDDKTNRDTQYLRARMRENIIPHLESMFGKNVSKNLCYAAKRSYELKSYLDKKTERAFMQIKKCFLGLFLDFSSFEMEDIEIIHLLKRIEKELGKDFSRGILEKILLSLKNNIANYRLSIKGNFLYIDKKRFFIFKNKLPYIQNGLDLVLGQYFFGPWKICVSRVKKSDRLLSYTSGWKMLWENECVLFLPEKKYSLDLPRVGDYYRKKRFKKWCYEKQIPSILRFLVPVVRNDQEIVGEFVTGEAGYFFSESTFLRISISLPGSQP